jgi:hypothetical protein
MSKHAILQSARNNEGETVEPLRAGARDTADSITAWGDERVPVKH